MSIIKSIKQVLGLSGTAAENHFWDGSVPNQLSLKRGTPDAPGAELIKALNGVLSFPNQGQSLVTANGYVKLPGGLIVQWRQVSTDVAGGFNALLPIAFPTGILLVTATHAGSSSAAAVRAVGVEAVSGNQTVIGYISTATVGQVVNVLALGY